MKILESTSRIPRTEPQHTFGAVGQQPVQTPVGETSSSSSTPQGSSSLTSVRKGLSWALAGLTPFTPIIPTVTHQLFSPPGIHASEPVRTTEKTSDITGKTFGELVGPSTRDERIKFINGQIQLSWKPIYECLEKGASLSTVKDINLKWNDVLVYLHVTDNTNIKESDEIRNYIIEKGATNPDIPPEVVHGALYTSAIIVGEINTELDRDLEHVATLKKDLSNISRESTPSIPNPDLRKKELEASILEKENKIASLNERRLKIAEGAVPYLGMNMVDTKTMAGRKERHLTTPDKYGDFKKDGVEVKVYDNSNFTEIAAFVIGQSAEPKLLAIIEEQLGNVGNDSAQRDVLHKVYMSLKSGYKPSEKIIAQARVWVFGAEQLAEHKKALEKLKAPVMPPVDAKPEKTETPKPKPPDTSTTIPGAPTDGKKAGSLSELKKIKDGDKLLTPKLPYDEKDLSFRASNILLLARNNDETALAACSQWFAMKHHSSGIVKNHTLTNSDLIVLQALGSLAQKDKTAFEVLTRVGTSFPNLVIADTMLTGSRVTSDIPRRHAAEAVLDAMKANPKEAEAWIRDLANKTAKGICNIPTGRDDAETNNTVKDEGKKLATLVMAHMDINGVFTKDLFKIVKDPYVRLHKQEDLKIAMIGLALARNQEAIEPLLEIGLDPKIKDTSLKELALQSVLYIDSIGIIPKALLDKAKQDAPFSIARLNYFYNKKDPKTNKLAEPTVTQLSENPFHATISEDYSRWLRQLEQLRDYQTKSGNEATNVSESTKSNKLFEIASKEFGGTNGALALKGQDATFNKKFVGAIVKYLTAAKDDTTNPLDPAIAIPMMNILGKCTEKSSKETQVEIAKVLRDIVTNPLSYTTPTPSGSTWGAGNTGSKATVIKRIAIRNLGATVNLSDPEDQSAETLHRIAHKNTSAQFRADSLLALETLAARYEEKLNSKLEPEEKEALEKARKAHGKKIIDWMLYHNAPSKPPYNTFMYAKVADKFGVTKELIELACKEASKDAKAPIVQAIMNGVVCNFRTMDQVKALSFDKEVREDAIALFQKFDKQEFFLGPAKDQQYTGDGVGVAVIDGGLASPIMGLAERLIYPRNVRWNDQKQFTDEHPTAVSWTFHRVSPGKEKEGTPPAKIRTFNFDADLLQDRFRPTAMQDPTIQALEELIELKINGANLQLVNHSYTLLNFLLNDEKVRTNIIDLLSAHMELLGKFGVKHSAAAGNWQGMDDIRVRHEGPLYEVTSLGLRNGSKKPDMIFIAAALNAFTDTLTGFSSKGNELKVDEAVEMLSFHGEQVVFPWVENGKWVLTSGNGTSFAAPHQMAILAWGTEARKKAGLRDLTASEWQQVFKSSTKQLKDRLGKDVEDYEGGKRIDVPTFLVNCLKPEPPKVTEKKKEPVKVVKD